MKVKWYGHAAFRLLPGDGPTVITDPYTPEGVGYAPIPDTADLVLISSDDDDAHCRADLIPGAPTVLNALTVAQNGGAAETAGISVTAIEAAEWDHHPEHEVPGQNGMYRFTLDGIKCAHMGDVGNPLTDAQIAFFEDVDILFALAGGYLTIELPDLMEMIHRVRPKLVIPMHFRTLTYRPRNTMWIDSFLSHFKEEDTDFAFGSEIEISKADIDWHETHLLLKVAFPVNVASPRATYEIQWGSIERPTHRNTLWDYAKFEVPAQKWADLSEGDYGVALLNDCKYGYDIRDNVMRLSLIKAATMPDPIADQGHHRMTYALLPHEGDWRGDVMDAAYDLNRPLRTVYSAAQPSIVEVDAENFIVETIKAAEDGHGIIVRGFEAHRQRGPVTLTFSKSYGRISLCNLLEEPISTIAENASEVRLDITPFEIVSLLLERQTPCRALRQALRSSFALASKLCPDAEFSKVSHLGYNKRVGIRSSPNSSR